MPRCLHCLAAIVDRQTSAEPEPPREFCDAKCEREFYALAESEYYAEMDATASREIKHSDEAIA